MSELFYAKIKEATLDWDNKNAVGKYLFGLEGKKVWVQIDTERPKRTLDQNAWLWGVVYKTCAEATGHTENEIHEIYKRMFLPPKYVKYRGKEIKLPATTTQLSKAEFSEYIERVRAEIANFGVIIPDPIKSY